MESPSGLCAEDRHGCVLVTSTLWMPAMQQRESKRNVPGDTVTPNHTRAQHGRPADWFPLLWNTSSTAQFRQQLGFREERRAQGAPAPAKHRNAPRRPRGGGWPQHASHFVKKKNISQGVSVTCTTQKDSGLFTEYYKRI